MSIETPQRRKSIETENEVVSESNTIVIKEESSVGKRKTEYSAKGHCAYGKTVSHWRESIDDWHPVDGELIENLSISIKDDGSIVLRESGRNRDERKIKISERDKHVGGGFVVEVSLFDSDVGDWVPENDRVIRHIDVDVPQYMVGDNR
jgi:hypothetical protein